MSQQIKNSLSSSNNKLLQRYGTFLPVIKGELLTCSRERILYLLLLETYLLAGERELIIRYGRFSKIKLNIAISVLIIYSLLFAVRYLLK